MTARPKLILSWSSGKDSAFALHTLRAQNAYEIVGLLTTVNQVHERVAMHAVRRELLQSQARAARLPLFEVDLPYPCSNDEYEARMRGFVERALGLGVSSMAFGDLFLEDVRAYRERQLAGTGLTPVFPLWGKPTPELAREMIASGLRAFLTCVDPRQISVQFAGRAFDQSLLDELPAEADPCGERGEFHTFVWAGPMFDAPLNVTLGEIVERDGFVFADLVPGGTAPAP
ncbi:MAG TPA: hypothetical protein VHV51_15550 [Polyangiaceae bacterium]|jgi:uncharacterized protein (TIGR00290 family)|nr:hypothetical protein [Polyangiaceae bacterium]